MTSGVEDVLVVGVGNELLGDEGAGVAVVRRLAECDLPEGVWVLDGATGGLDLLFELEQCRLAVIVDAADMGLAPGSVRCFSPADVDHEVVGKLASLHQIGLRQVLRLGEALGGLPEMRIVGIQPKAIDHRIGLSEEVSGAIERAAEQVRAAIGELRRDATVREGHH